MAKFAFTFSSPKPTAKSKKVYEKTKPIIKKNVSSKKELHELES